VARNEQPYSDTAGAGWVDGIPPAPLPTVPANLFIFSIKTKGLRNFLRRVHTIFTRFGFSERRGANGLHAIVDALEPYGAGPTFYVPGVVLQRHPQLMAGIAARGAEIGLHGDVHVDYRLLDRAGQYEHTERAIAIFDRHSMPWQGFRNPYLGWTSGSVVDCAELGVAYDSNEAVDHDISGLNLIQPELASGYSLSLSLYQALPCTAYNLRPRREDGLVRVPISIPDDEMLFDRLRLNVATVGQVWSVVMQKVYDLGGVYALNLHPERGMLCRGALDTLLQYAARLPLPVWLDRMDAIADWWRRRCQATLQVTPSGEGRWDVTADAPDEAVLLVRNLTVDDAPSEEWFGSDRLVRARRVHVQADRCPVVALSERTPPPVAAFLREQGYPVVCVTEEESAAYALYLDEPEGLGLDRRERAARCSRLVQLVETAEVPLVRLGLWPNGSRAALAISSDVDSITVQDFLLRILEWRDIRNARQGQARQS